MELDINDLNAEYRRRREHRGASDTHRLARAAPKRRDYDYLVLSGIAANLRALMEDVPRQGGRALDIGSAESPYAQLLHAAGFAVETLDVSSDVGATHVGSAVSTGLPSDTFDLILCTQVLEHVDDPVAAMREIKRILRPGGHLLLTVPHIWPYHPCPEDYWRFTQRGVVELCSRSGLAARRLASSGGGVAAFVQLLNIMLFGVLGRWGAPVYLLTNTLGELLDRVARTDLMCMNFACLAEKELR